MEQVPLLRDLGQRLGRKAAGKGIAAALKVSNRSLRYLASYARIAIQGGGFSPEVAGNDPTERAIKLRKAASLG
jgi:hypothetical protein